MSTGAQPKALERPAGWSALAAAPGWTIRFGNGWLEIRSKTKGRKAFYAQRDPVGYALVMALAAAPSGMNDGR